MVALGFGECIGAVLQGYIIDRQGSRKTSFINFAMVAVAFSLTIRNLMTLEYGLLTYEMCFCWGLLDAAVNVHTN